MRRMTYFFQIWQGFQNASRRYPSKFWRVLVTLPGSQNLDFKVLQNSGVFGSSCIHVHVTALLVCIEAAIEFVIWILKHQS